jgi:hypothetical protein
VAFIRAFGPARPAEESIGDTEFDRSVRRLQAQFQQLESELKKLNR